MHSLKRNKASDEMQDVLKVTQVGQDIVNGIYVACGENFQVTIGHGVYMDWQFKLRNGQEIFIAREHIDSFDGVHIFE